MSRFGIPWAWRTGIILLVALVVYGFSANGEVGGCLPKGELNVCQTEGFGTILNNDTAQARDEALIDARRRALEHVAGVQVDA